MPNSLGNPDTGSFLPPNIKDHIVRLSYFVVEKTRNARRYLKTIDQGIQIDELTFFELNKHTNPKDIEGFLRPVMEGDDMGIISEAGLPGIADPGAALVKLAHEKEIVVVPLTGPSSIFMALMASGFNGQSFRFVGYLPVQRNERIQQIKYLEKTVEQKNETQIFIETPYRNNALLDDICSSCRKETLLTVAVDITTEKEMIKTATISYWKKEKPDLHKRPAVFLIGKSD